MTPSEYAAIGRRIGHLQDELQMDADRAALWEKLQEVKRVLRNKITYPYDQLIHKDAIALLESLGGSDG